MNERRIFKRPSNVIHPFRDAAVASRSETLSAAPTKPWHRPRFDRRVRDVVLIGLCCMGGPLISGPHNRVVTLFTAADFPNGWSHHSAEKETKLNEVWKPVKGTEAANDELVCLGKPFGYLRTNKLYDNFEFRLEWRYPKENANGNSGILIYTAKKDKIWPNAIQVQLHSPTAGSVFPSGKAEADNKLMVTDLSKPAGQWNSCVITSKAGRVTVMVNGKKAGEVTGCKPAKGGIALQSEGSEVHFRRIMLKSLN